MRRMIVCVLVLAFSCPALAYRALAYEAQKKDADDWKNVTNSTELGDLSIGVAMVRRGKVLLTDESGDSFSDRELLTVFIGIHNGNVETKRDYLGWSAPAFDLKKTAVAAAADELGNSYKRVTFRGKAEVVDQLKEGRTIEPQKTVVDVLVFEVPVGKAKELRISLPGEALGEKETIKIKVPIEDEDERGLIFDAMRAKKEESSRPVTAEKKAARPPGKTASARSKAEQDQDEQAADTKLKAANKLLTSGRRVRYQQALREIVEKYPDTAAGKKAAKLLK